MQYVVNGISLAAVYALAAVGISLVFGLTGIVNFAHGEFIVVGAYMTYEVGHRGGALFIPALFASIATVTTLSLLVERLLFRRTLRRPIVGFVVSLGLILVVHNVVVALWDTGPRYVRPLVDGRLSVGSVSLATQRIVVVAIGVAVFALLYALLRWTAFGLRLRAVASDRETAGLVGINVPAMVSGTFLLGGALAGVGGSLLATLFPVTPSLGSNLVMKAFAVALIGGLGSVSGGVMAACLLGLSEALIVGYGPSRWVDVITFAIMLAVLLVRPQGIVRGAAGSSVQ